MLKSIKEDNILMSLIKGSSLSFIIKVTGMLFSYISMLYITNYFGAEEWGLYSLCFTLLNITVLIPRFGFDTAIVRIIGELKVYEDIVSIKSALKKIVSITIILSILTTVTLYALKTPMLKYIIKQPNFDSYFNLVLCAISPLAILTVIYATFQAFNKIKEFMTLKTTLINFLFLMFLIIYHVMGVEEIVFKLYFFSICLTLCIGAVLFFMFFNKLIFENPKPTKSFSFREITRISSPMFFSSSVSLLLSSVDIMMLSYYFSSEEVGIFNSCIKLSALSFIPLLAVNSIVTQKFIEYYTRKDYLGLKEVVQKSTKMIFYATAPILLILILLPKTILGFFGEVFIFGSSTLIILCIAKFFNAISGSVGFVMQMTDQQKVYQYIILVALIINIILNFFFIPLYGYFGAAIANAIATVFWNLALIITIRKKLGFWTIYFPGIKQ